MKTTAALTLLLCIAAASASAQVTLRDEKAAISRIQPSANSGKWKKPIGITLITFHGLLMMLPPIIGCTLDGPLIKRLPAPKPILCNIIHGLSFVSGGMLLKDAVKSAVLAQPMSHLPIPNDFAVLTTEDLNGSELLEAVKSAVPVLPKSELPTPSDSAVAPTDDSNEVSELIDAVKSAGPVKATLHLPNPDDSAGAPGFLKMELRLQTPNDSAVAPTPVSRIVAISLRVVAGLSLMLPPIIGCTQGEPLIKGLPAPKPRLCNILDGFRYFCGVSVLYWLITQV